MAGSAGFTDFDVLMVNVADLADGSHTANRDISQLAGRETDKRISAFFCHQLSLDAGGASQLSTLAGIHLHVVDEGTDGNVGQRKGVAGLDVSAHCS